MQWKGISFFLGALTITLGVLVWFVLGTPREVRWLNEDEKRAATAHVVCLTLDISIERLVRG